MEIYSLFIGNVLYGIYRNKKDADFDCEAVKRIQVTRKITVKQHTLMEFPMHDENVGNPPMKRISDITNTSEYEITRERVRTELKWENTETLTLVKNGNIDGLKYAEKIGRVDIYRNPNILKTAVEYNCFDIVKYAVEKSSTTTKYSALQVALDQGNLLIFEFLLDKLQYHIHRRLAFDIAIKCVKNNYIRIIEYIFQNRENPEFQPVIPIIVVEAISTQNFEVQRFLKSLGLEEEIMLNLYKEHLLRDDEENENEINEQIQAIEKTQEKKHNEYHKIMGNFKPEKAEKELKKPPLKEVSPFSSFDQVEKMVKEKDFPGVKDLINKGKIAPSHALRLACENDYPELVEYLIPSITMTSIGYCLIIAIEKGFLGIVKYILEYLKFYITEDVIRQIAFHCEKKNDEKMIEYVLSIPNMLLQEKILTGLIDICIKNDNIKMLEFLQNLGIDVKTILTHNEYPNKDRILCLLGIEKIEEINEKEKEEEIMEMVKEKIKIEEINEKEKEEEKKKKKTEIVKIENEPPILCAVRNGNMDRFLELLNEVDLNEEIIKDILKIAAENNRINIMQHLEGLGIEIRDHPTLLNSALFSGHDEMVRYLLSIGFNSGNAFLFYANDGNINMLEWIIKNIGKNRVGIRNIELSMKTAIENKRESVIKFLELVMNL